MEPQSQQPIQDKTESRSLVKTNWKFVTIVAVLGLVVAAILFGLQYLRGQYEFRDPHEAQIIERQKQEQERKIQELNRNRVDTSTWQTYRSDEFGFEVRFSAWWVEDIGAINLINPESGSSFQVTKNGNPDNLSLDEWFKQAVLINGRPTAKASAERITINGIPAYKLETELAPPNPLFEVVAIANSQGDIFSIYAYYKTQEDAETLDQILSTFRFVP